MQGEQTLYEVLGVSPDAPLDEIKKAHRRQMRVHHPDVYSGSRNEAEEIASHINKAYATLSNEEERAKYDAFLRGEAPQDKATTWDEEAPFEDDWGTEADWDEVIEDEVVEDPEPMPEPQPTPEPGPQPTTPAPAAWQSAAASVAESEISFTTPLTGLRPPLLVALSGVLAGTILGLIAPSSSEAPGVAGAGFAAVLGAVLGALVVTVLKKKGKEPSLVARPLLTVSVTILLALGGSLVLLGLTAVAAGLVAAASAFIGVYILLRALAVRSMMERNVKAESLRKNNTFGGMPGGVGPDLLNRTLSALYAIPSVRIMRNPDNDGLFSHAITNGRKVVFVKGITGFSGLYRWSGPSLLLDRSAAAGDGIPVEVLRATYREFSMNLTSRLPKGTQAETWLFVYTQDGDHIVYRGDNAEGNPKVTASDVGLDQVGRFLIDGETENPSVDQEAFIKTFTALLG